MIATIIYLLLCVPLLLFTPEICKADLPPSPPWLVLYSPGEPEYPDVLVKRVYDNLTLVCELRGDATPSVFVWNYIPSNTSVDSRPYIVEPHSGATLSSTLYRQQLSITDSGHYMCSAPPFSVTKYIIVQEKGPKSCSRGSFWCGSRCVLGVYVCDGRRDCLGGEDEAPPACMQPCARSDKLNCSSGRCLSEAACCRTASSTCQHPSCCDEHLRYSRLQGYDVEFPPLFEDRHAPDDYGFIQSTIYTVTACALIFMIAVVLLVSAICKMHMKRAALRSYAHADRATAAHYNMHYAQSHRYPPCYEASRLLEDARLAPALARPSSPSSPSSPTSPTSPTHAALPTSPTTNDIQNVPAQCSAAECAATYERRGLSRLSSIFTNRYRQVPTTSEVEMTDVRSSSLNNSPTRTQRTLDNYRSPTYCDLNTEFFFNQDTSNCGRDLNYMATPIDFFRRRAMRRNTLERVIDQLNDRQRPLTLQLGRFQLSIPRFGRRRSTERRPDTPNVAEISVDDLDFVRLNTTETYTLNGRTIRLLGGDFENYPVLPDGTRPPPYNEAMRYKVYGPPPEYLSREGLNASPNADEEATNNVEMPPCYDDLASGVDSGDNGNVVTVDNGNTVNGNSVSGLLCNGNNGITVGLNNVSCTTNNGGGVCSNGNNGNSIISIDNVVNNGTTETINSVIDNLPAIDSDVNANDTIETRNVVVNVN